MKAKDVLAQYQYLWYRATDGKFYKLKERYSWVFSVDKKIQNRAEEVFALDTGGMMSDPNIDFFCARITEDRKLLRQDIATKKWFQYSPEIKISFGDPNLEEGD